MLPAEPSNRAGDLAEEDLARLRWELVERELRHRVEQYELQRELGVASDEIARQAQAVLTLQQEMRTLEERTRASGLELTGRENEWKERADKLSEAWATVQLLREQRDVAVEQRNDVARRLASIETTLSYRLASAFWRLMTRLVPATGRRRAAYRLVRRAAERVVGSPTRTVAAPDAEPAPAAPDLLGDLLRFEERVHGTGGTTAVVIFATTALRESEGQRPTQIALELSRRGIPVVFCYWRWWPHEWCEQDRLDQGIVQVPIDLVVQRPELLAGLLANRPERLALFEFPYPGFFEILATLNAQGWITVYDVLDDWQEFHRVGQAVWYDEDFERHIIHAADAVFAVNAVLGERVEELGGRSVAVLGNGLAPGIERVQQPHSLARGEVTVGYFGYLAGAWFDWSLVAEAARSRPGWMFYLVGYGGAADGVELPPNVTLLGKQPQSELAALAANWDVAVVPFKGERLAAGADPIKTYEYLAMGLPVVVTGVFPPPGGESFVRRADDLEGFLAAVEHAAREPREKVDARRSFAAACSWGRRLDDLFAATRSGEQRVGQKLALGADAR